MPSCLRCKEERWPFTKHGAEPLLGLAAFLQPFADLVGRKESKQALERYTTGLLSDLPRKTAAGMGRALPGTNDQRLREFLTNTAWDTREMDRLRIAHMAKYATAGDGVLIVDDTGIAKIRKPFRGGRPAILGQVGSGGQLPGAGHDPSMWTGYSTGR